MSLQSQIELFVTGKSRNTQSTYLSLSRSFEKYLHDNGLNVDTLAPLHLKAWITGFNSRNSQASAKRFLCAYFRFVGKLNLVASLNATTKEVRSEFKFAVDLKPEEVNRIIDACPETKYKLADSLMAFNGLRVGEVLGLYWQDIDIENQTIQLVRRSNERYGPKGMKPGDKPVIIPLNSASSQLYRQLRGETNSEGRIFTMSYKTFLKWFSRYVKDSGVKRSYPITPHKLRHAFAHLWINNKGSMRKLQAILRHKKADTTSIYTAPSTEELKEEFSVVIEQCISVGQRQVT